LSSERSFVISLMVDYYLYLHQMDYLFCLASLDYRLFLHPFRHHFLFHYLYPYFSPPSYYGNYITNRQVYSLTTSNPHNTKILSIIVNFV
jgi:hypothetical protein